MSEPWTRSQQINYAVFGKKEGVPEYNAVFEALYNFAKATDARLGESTLVHFIKFYKHHLDASMSVD